MVCYTVPLAAAIIHGISRKTNTVWTHNVHHLWLSLLLVGGALFGIVDHLWNGELFLIGENIVSDLALGVTITIVIFIVWVLIVALDKSAHKTPSKTLQ